MRQGLSIVVLAAAAMIITACQQTALRSDEKIRETGLEVREDGGEHSGGLVGRNFEWRMEKELAELQRRCAEIGIGAAEDAAEQCVAIIGGTPNAMSLDDYLLPEDPRKWFFAGDYVNNRWRRFLAYRANFVKKSYDAAEYRDIMQEFLRHQYQLIEEREALGDVTAGAPSY